MSLENPPDWIKKSEIWQNREDYDFDTSKEIPLYECKIKSMKDLKNVFKTIVFWKIPSPYPYELWKHILNPKNNAKVVEYIDRKYQDSRIMHLHEFMSMNEAYTQLELSIVYNEIEVLKYLHDREKDLGENEPLYMYKENEYLMESAVEFERLEIGELAASNGNLEILMYLHENECPWDSGTVYSAAHKGKLECLKYAVEPGGNAENGCEYSLVMLKNYSERSGNKEIQDYVKTLE